jgi:hypothetical protein
MFELNMEAICSAEMVVITYRTIRRHSPEDQTPNYGYAVSVFKAFNLKRHLHSEDKGHGGNLSSRSRERSASNWVC